MRFLMNTLLALISTAVDSCVLAKLSLDALGRAAVFGVLCEAWLPPSRVTGAAKLQLSVFWHQFNPASQSSCYGNIRIQSLSTVVCTPIAHGTFPIR
jgi:hypothetical protein